MDLLLQAAKVLESENSGINSDRTAGRSTRGSHIHGSFKSRGEAKAEGKSRTLSGSSISLDDNGGAVEDDTGLSGEKRRAGGAGTREVHNQLEKNRRKQMRECFNQLQLCIPSLENKRVATHSILQGAIKHIKNLKKKDVEQEREIQMLAKKKSDLKKKYDVEFNKCSEEQQRKATEVRMRMEKSHNHAAYDDDDDDDEDHEEEGNVSDSTSTASEGPGNEENFSDDEKGNNREKPHISRVNPIVAAKLDGFRKRKLATLDLYPKSTDYIIASMNDAGYLTATSSKQKPAAMSSSSSAALKNMLEQKKRQQSGFPSALVPGPPPVVDQERPKIAAASTKFPSTKGMSSLTSSHPMISHQLAAATSIPLAMPTASVLTANLDESTDSSTQTAIVAGSNFSPMKNRAPTVISLTGLPNKIHVVESDKSPHSVLFNPPTTTNSLLSAVLPRSTVVQEVVSNLQLQSRHQTNSLPITSDGLDYKMRAHLSFPNSSKSPPVLAQPVNVFLDNSNSLGKSTVNLPTTLPNHTTSPPAIPPQQSISPGSNKVVPTMFPLSLIQGLALNHNCAPVAVPPSNSGVSSAPAVSLISAVSPVLQPKIHPSEILIASPVKTDSNPAIANPVAGRVTTLLAATTQANSNVIKANPTFVGSLPVSNVVSTTVTSPSVVTPTAAMALPEGLKTVALTPTILPFTVTTGPLAPPNSTSISPGTPLRFFTPLTPSSVVTAPLTNGQTSLMPAVVQLDGSGQVTVLQNIVQLQTSQMLGQPIMVVTTPNSIIAPVTATTATVNVTHSSSSSTSLL